MEQLNTFDPNHIPKMKIEKKAQAQNEPDHNGADNITSHEYAVELAKNNRSTWHETPESLIENGMCLCDTCGEIASIEDSECLTCGQTIVIFKTK